MENNFYYSKQLYFYKSWSNSLFAIRYKVTSNIKVCTKNIFIYWSYWLWGGRRERRCNKVYCHTSVGRAPGFQVTTDKKSILTTRWLFGRRVLSSLVPKEDVHDSLILPQIRLCIDLISNIFSTIYYYFVALNCCVLWQVVIFYYVSSGTPKNSTC